MQSQFDKYEIPYLIEQYEKMKIIYSDDHALLKGNKLAMMKKAFKSYDKDGNGVLDRIEIVDLLSNHFKETGIKRRPNKIDVNEFFDSLDKDHNGTIDFDEFKKFLIDNMKKKLMGPLKDYLNHRGIYVE